MITIVQSASLIDLILSCGDLKQWYLSYLMSYLQCSVVLRAGQPRYIFRGTPDGGENIHGKIVNYKGIRIMGLEGSQVYSREAVQYTEREMYWTYQRMRFQLWRHRGVDIVLTHSPPEGIHDMDTVTHRGFRIFNHIIKKHRPKYHIHGHTHLNYGRSHERVSRVDDTYVINAYGFYILDFEKGPEASSRYQTPR